MYINSFKFLVRTSQHIKFGMANFVGNCTHKIVVREMKEHCDLYTQRRFTILKIYLDSEFHYLENSMNKKDERLLYTDSKKYLENLVEPGVNSSG